MNTERNQTDAAKVPDEEVRRLLARATEIESAQSVELSISDLREVALEAGIAPNAFEQAVVELGTHPAVIDVEEPKPVGKVRSRFVTVLLDSARTVLLVLATLFVLMLMVDWLG